MIERVRDGNQGFVVSTENEQQEDVSFIPFEHTQFSKDNTKAMALLIILFER